MRIKQRKKNAKDIDIYYYSATGNTKSFANKLADIVSIYPIANDTAKPAQDFVLFTPTYNFGEVPAPVRRFLDDHNEHLIGVVAFGNRNWGGYYAKAGDIIAQKYNVPLLKRIELRGTTKDYEFMKELLS